MVSRKEERKSTRRGPLLPEVFRHNGLDLVGLAFVIFEGAL